MPLGEHLLIFSGFVMACVGFGLIYYVCFSLLKSVGFRSFLNLDHAQYRNLVKERWGSLWPIVAAAICTSVGIAVMVIAAIYRNHVR